MGTTPDTPGPELNDDDAAAFDDLGRRAGAALRRPAPEHGASAVARRGRRQQAVRGVVVGGVALGALVGAMFVVTRGDGSDPLTPVDTVADTLAPTTTAAPVLTPVDTVPDETTTTLARAGDPSPGATISNGWVAFAAGNPQSDIYLVQEGTPARRIAGSDTDGIEQGCPAFSPDGTRLAYGQATGDQGSGYQDAVLVITDLSAAGDVATTDKIVVDDISRPPCAIWSADGRRVAFGAGTPDPQVSLVSADVDEVWVVDTETDDIRRLSGLKVSDIEWAPDATELLIASDGGIVVYSVATDEIRPLGDVSGVESFALSPDGRTIAFTRPHPGLPDYVKNLWLMDADGTDERILAATFGLVHGIGPVWSPDGEHIVYQQLCDLCREESEVVVVTVSDNDPLEPAGTQVVIPTPETTGPDGALDFGTSRVSHGRPTARHSSFSATMSSRCGWTVRRHPSSCPEPSTSRGTPDSRGCLPELGPSAVISPAIRHHRRRTQPGRQHTARTARRRRRQMRRSMAAPSTISTIVPCLWCTAAAAVENGAPSRRSVSETAIQHGKRHATSWVR